MNQFLKNFIKVRSYLRRKHTHRSKTSFLYVPVYYVVIVVRAVNPWCAYHPVTYLRTIFQVTHKLLNYIFTLIFTFNHNINNYHQFNKSNYILWFFVLNTMDNLINKLLKSFSHHIGAVYAGKLYICIVVQFINLWY